MNRKPPPKRAKIMRPIVLRRSKAPRFDLWVNDEPQGTHESEDAAEMHVHELQVAGLCVTSVVVKMHEGS